MRTDLFPVINLRGLARATPAGGKSRGVSRITEKTMRVARFSSSINTLRRHVKSISRNIYIDVSVLSALLLLYIVTHPYVCYKLFKKFLFALLSFVLLYSSVHLFFLDFLTGFFVQNKMASFWHWKKKYTLQRLFLFFLLAVALFSIVTSFPLINLSVNNQIKVRHRE
jgi:hypothetical protein